MDRSSVRAWKQVAYGVSPPGHARGCLVMLYCELSMVRTWFRKLGLRSALVPVLGAHDKEMIHGSSTATI